MKVKVFYTKIQEPLSPEFRSAFLKECPEEMVSKNNRFIKWQDRDANLAGKFLLVEALKTSGYQGKVLFEINYTEFGRPFLMDAPDFSISHSGEYVICVMASPELRVGVDIEEVRSIEMNSFIESMTTKQLEEIQRSTYPLNTFYDYWTMKESVVKADGRGLTIPLIDIVCQNNVVEYESTKWYIHQPFFKPDYRIAIAVNCADCLLEWHSYSMDEQR